MRIISVLLESSLVCKYMQVRYSKIKSFALQREPVVEDKNLHCYYSQDKAPTQAHTTKYLTFQVSRQDERKKRLTFL